MVNAVVHAREAGAEGRRGRRELLAAAGVVGGGGGPSAASHVGSPSTTADAAPGWRWEAPDVSGPAVRLRRTKPQ